MNNELIFIIDNLKTQAMLKQLLTIMTNTKKTLSESNYATSSHQEMVEYYSK